MAVYKVSAGEQAFTDTGDVVVLEDVGDTLAISKMKAYNADGLKLQTSTSSTALFVKNDGNIGIGTSTPTAPLEVDGDIQLSPTAISTAHIASSGSLKIDADANMEIGHSLVDSVRIGRSNTALAKVHIRSGSDTDLVVSDGKVGIGMDDPSHSLEVDGDIQLSPTAISTAHISSSGSLKIDADSNMEIGHTLVDSVRIGRSNTGGVKVHVRSGSDSDLVVSDGKVGAGTDSPNTQLTVEGSITLKEQAAADSDTAAYGQLWTKTATPNELYFTTDAGDDIQLTSGTAIAAATSMAADDLGVGDAETSLATSSGSVTVDSQASTVLVDGHTGVEVTSTNSGAVTIDGKQGVSIQEDGTDAIVVADTGYVTTLKVEEAAIAQASDYVLFLDGGATGDVKTESVGDFLTAIAGSGLSVSSSQLTAAAGGGAQAQAVNTVTSTTVLTSSHGTILCNTSGGALSITLPSSGLTDGSMFQIKDMGGAGTHNVTIDRATNSVNIDGAGTDVVISTNGASVTLVVQTTTSPYGYWIV